MVLVTHNMEEYTTTQNLTEAADNNAVWPILYPCDSTVSTAVYDKLADISPDTSVLTVVNGIYEFAGLQYQSIQNSADLHRSLTTAFANPATGVSIHKFSFLMQNMVLHGAIWLTSTSFFR